jgi:hypothetical protein
MLVIGTSFSSAIEINNEKEINNEEENKVYFLNSENVKSDIFFDGIKTTLISQQNENQNAENINLDIKEDINIKNDGSAELDITMELSSKKLIDLYKESLGVTSDLTEVDMEIPEQTNRQIFLEKDDGTIQEQEFVEPVRERFFDGIIEEQKFLYGVHITEFISSRIYSSNLNNELFINVKADALPYITNIADNVITIQSAPKQTTNTFIIEQMELSKVMIQSFSGNQVYTKNVDININLPKNAEIKNFENNGKFFDFGSASFSTDLTTKTASEIGFSEEWNIFEGEKITKENEINNLFSFNYEVESTKELLDFSNFNYDFDMSTFNDEPWSWSTNWDLITLEDNEGDLTYLIDVDLYLTLSGSLHVDLGKSKIYAQFGITAGLEVDVTISGQYTDTFNLLGGMQISGDQYSWRGCQALAVTVHVEPEAQIYVSVQGSVYIHFNPEANFNLKAGGDLDFQWAWPPVHFKPIFDFTTGGSLGDPTIQLSCSATVKPSLGFALSLLVFEIIGPRITPTIYFEGQIGWDSNDGAYWKGELGFDLFVGIQFTRFLHYNWPDPVYNTPLKTWKGTFNPVDNSPPTTTLYMGPEVNGYVGPLAFFWFKAKDDGPEGEGISETKFKIPEATDNSWHTFDYLLTHLIISNVENYNVKYYSTDISGNQENTKTKSVQADLTRPDLGLDFDGEYNKINDNRYEILKSSTKVYLLGKEVGTRKTNVRVWYKATHESGYETEWKYTDFYTGSKWYGWELTFGDLGRWTVEWVAEDGVWNVRSHELTLDVKDTFIPPSIELEAPRPGDLIFSGSYIGNFGFSMALFLICPNVQCTAYDDETGVAKVVFECGGKTDTDDSPSNGYFQGSIENVPTGLHRLYARAYDSNNDLVDSDSVSIIKFGGS